MSLARRNLVDREFEQAKAPNLALLLQRGLAETDVPASRDVLLSRVTNLIAGDFYAAAFQWRRDILARNPHTRSVVLAASAGLAVGLGNESVLEVGLTLLHPYGIPYLPGSALKGLARSHARLLITQGDADGLTTEQTTVLFGDLAAAGYITFHDAWYVPGSAPGDRPLAREVVTVHHPNYYMKKDGQRRAPWDFDDPTPVGYVTARGSYQVTVEGPTAEWAEWALMLLRRALAEDGAGGKTNAGFGRLRSDEARVGPAMKGTTATPASAVEKSPAIPAPASLTEAQKLMAAVEQIPAKRIKEDIGGIINKWRGLRNDQAGKLAAGRVILAKIEALHDAKWAEKSAGYREVRGYLREHGGEA